MPVRGRVYGKQSGTAEDWIFSLRLWSRMTGDEGFFVAFSAAIQIGGSPLADNFANFVKNQMNIKEF